MVVPDYQLSLAIGREGQNARLAARLTGWRIDIHSDTEGSGGPASKEGPESLPRRVTTPPAARRSPAAGNHSAGATG